MKRCTARTVRCYDARRYNTALRDCCREHVRHLVEVTAEALNAAGATWWADYGTLLGAVRNPMTTWEDYPWLPAKDGPIAPGIVPHDKDADLGVMNRDWKNVSRAMARISGGRVGKHNLAIRSPRGSMKLKLSVLNHTNVDLFFWHERADGMLFRKVYNEVDNFKGKDFHKDLLFPLTTVEWEGMELPAPRDPEAFLEMRYGPNWRTPVMANHDGVKR